MQISQLSLVISVFIKNSGLVLIFYGAFHYRLYIQRAQDIDFKYNPRWPSENSKQFLFGNQTKDNIFLTFCSGVLIWTCFEICILWFAANGYLRLISLDENMLYFVAMILLIHLWRDLHFYLIHRLIHFQPLYNLAHKTHHRNINPGPWSGLAMHPIEHIFYFSCAFLYLFFPFHPAFIIVTLVHAGLSPAPGHAGFERIKTDEKQAMILIAMRITSITSILNAITRMVFYLWIVGLAHFMTVAKSRSTKCALG